MDAEEVAARIREDVRRRRLRAAPSLQAIADIELLEATHDVYHVDLGSPRPLLGGPLRLLRAAVRRLLAPVLGRQVEFNAAVASFARDTNADLEALAERQEELRRMLADQAAELRALRGPR